MKATGIVEVSYNIPSALQPLVRLAMNMRWSWHRPTRELFESIDPDLWSRVNGPMALLHASPRSSLEALAADGEFLARMRAAGAELDAHLQDSLWFERSHDEHDRADAETTGVTNRTATDPIAAYFSMEFGIHPSLPIYSGGLGVLAGDHLKSASDLGVPLIGVGLLYTHGYFTQSLSADGWQEEAYVAHAPASLPVQKVRDGAGDHIHVEVDFPGHRTVSVALWVAQVGRVPLILLDTDIDANPTELRGITDRLYGGDDEHRVRQEIILGIGGVRAVNAFCDARGLMRPRVAHLNEGHAGFLGLERIRERMDEGATFDEALAITRAGNVFTTHTPVPSGIDRFDKEMVRRHIEAGGDGTSLLCPGVPVDRILELGAEDDPNRFNMANLALRLSQRANGVAKLHGAISRENFRGLYPGYEPDEVPIGSVTNGVHLPTWAHPAMEPVIAAACGGADPAVAEAWEHADAIGDEELWAARNTMRADLVDVARAALHDSWRHRGLDEAQLGWTRRVLDPDALTVGFARRVSTYKRLTLMLKAPDRLREILLDPDRPVQFVVAGKAHPRDMGGKQLMQELIRFADDAGVRDRFLFLPDYDMQLASHLVSGSDVWLNNPIRPQEASGTSGMKAVMNGGLTLSISDGWWDEMPQEGNGWTIPSVETHDQGYRDQLESQALYDLLEQEIVPSYYDRDDDGIPRAWLDRIRASLTALSPKVTATRMLREYVDGYYRPADHANRLMAADGDAARQFVNWTRHVAQGWPNITLSRALCDGAPIGDGTRVLAGEEFQICVDVELGTLAHEDVRVEAIVGDVDGCGGQGGEGHGGGGHGGGEMGGMRDNDIHAMEHRGRGRYSATIRTDRPGTFGYAVRVVPRHQLLAHPAETGLVKYL